MRAFTRKTPADIAKMRSAGRIVAEVLALVELELKPGVSTSDLDRLAERHIRDAGGTPSFVGYLASSGTYDRSNPRSYPASTCISIDDEVVHGIPGDREIRAGQLVSIDVGVIYRDWHGDGARTFVCGGVEATSVAAAKLVETTRLSLMAGIDAARPGRHIRDIGGAVEDIATGAGFGIVRNYGGHGIGRAMHEAPHVLNYRHRTRDSDIKLEPGMCLAIEPMLTLGMEHTHTLADGWTVSTVDGSLAAHFEHTIAITAKGPEILTKV